MFVPWPAKALRRLLRLSVATYRIVLSPDHGILRPLRGERQFCSTTPTCSTVALEALGNEQCSLRQAVAAIGRQLLRCHRSSRQPCDAHTASAIAATTITLRPTKTAYPATSRPSGGWPGVRR